MKTNNYELINNKIKKIAKKICKEDDYIINLIDNEIVLIKALNILPVFKKLWQLLNNNKCYKDNKFFFCDDDYSLWIEFPKQNKKHIVRKVIIASCSTVCRDDNTILYIYDEGINDNCWDIFRIARVWQRQKTNNKYKCGDDRDINIPSLNTYRKRNFRFGYYDCRDIGHVLKIQNGHIDNAYWNKLNAIRDLNDLNFYLTSFINDIRKE